MTKHPGFTRREFVSASSNIVAGSLLLSQIPQTLSAFVPGKKRRLAMVDRYHSAADQGAGRIALRKEREMPVFLIRSAPSF